jgi:hypothetical protein
MIPAPFAPLFSGPGRHYWGRYRTSCAGCWEEYRLLILDTPEMDKFFIRAEICTECAGTQRDAIPWTELFMKGREYGE